MLVSTLSKVKILTAPFWLFNNIKCCLLDVLCIRSLYFLWLFLLFSPDIISVCCFYPILKISIKEILSAFNHKQCCFQRAPSFTVPFPSTDFLLQRMLYLQNHIIKKHSLCSLQEHQIEGGHYIGVQLSPVITFSYSGLFQQCQRANLKKKCV